MQIPEIKTKNDCLNCLNSLNRLNSFKKVYLGL